MKNYDHLDKTELLDLLSAHTAEYTQLVKNNGRTNDIERLARIITRIQKAIRKKNGQIKTPGNDQQQKVA